VLLTTRQSSGDQLRLGVARGVAGAREGCREGGAASSDARSTVIRQQDPSIVGGLGRGSSRGGGASEGREARARVPDTDIDGA